MVTDKQLLETAVAFDDCACFFRYKNPNEYQHYYQLHAAFINHLIEETRLTTKQPLFYYVRFFHAGSDLECVDIYINEKMIFKSFSFEQISPYLTFASGTYRVEIYPAGTHTSPLLKKELLLQNGAYNTLALIGTTAEAQLIPYLDQAQSISPISVIRFLHLSKGRPSVDVSIKGGETLFKGIAYQKTSDFLNSTPMTTTLELKEANTKRLIAVFPNITLKPNQSHTLAWIKNDLKIL
jgi:hypothetical protein